MSEKLQDSEALITDALKAAGKYSAALSVNVQILSDLLRIREIYRIQIDNWFYQLDAGEIEWSEIAGDPLWKRYTETADTIRKQLKELDLTAAGTRGNIEQDPLADLVKDIHTILGGSDDVILPK